MKILRSNTFLGFTVAFIAALALTSCSGNGKSDAYGQFEATEITVSAQVGGKLVKFTVDEGDWLKKGVQVGLIDTTQLALKRKQLKAKIASIKAKAASISAKIDVQQEQLALAKNDLQRIKGMIEDGAATEKQLDDAQTRVHILKEKIEAMKAEKQAIKTKISSVKAHIAQVSERIQDAMIINPVKGTVLTSFVEPSEVVRRGQPLYRIADLDTLILQVYVSGAQLPHVKLGEKVEVLVDKNAKEYYKMHGTVTWIANKAEFTPQQIQTKEARVTQVYAVEVRVPNPKGILKIGMPGEVNF